MKKKLTLRMEQDVIERAKKYAEARGESVSKLVENYFRALTTGEQPNGEEEPLPPITRRLAGRLKGPEAERFSGDPDEAGRVDADLKEEYYRYLEEKHR